MSDFNTQLRSFAHSLHEVGAIKFGEFRTKCGLMSPVYCDLRVIVSHPKILRQLSEMLCVVLDDIKESFELICGVPYTALPIATAVSLLSGTPMVMRRKEAKKHGTMKLIEGTFRSAQPCLVLEDVVTSGGSVLETVRDLRAAGLHCEVALVVVDRQQGGDNILSTGGVRMHALYTLEALLEHLSDVLDADKATRALAHIRNTQIQQPAQLRLCTAFDKRITMTKNALAAELLDLMTRKRSTLCLAADLNDATQLLNLAEQVGPHICILKTHIDIVTEAYSEHFTERLRQIAHTHDFLLMEDRKFADIGSIVQKQFSGGVFRIGEWADFVTCHSLMGESVLQSIRKASTQTAAVHGRRIGVFLLAETSADGSLIDAAYTQRTIDMAQEHDDVVVGVVCQNALFTDTPNLIQLTPGIRFDVSNDDNGQRYNTPETMVSERGADVCVVGRGITEHKDPATAALQYKTILWQSYCNRVGIADMLSNCN